MFREMLRSKQHLTKDECVRILKEQKRGVLAVLGDEGYPYCMPIDHWYDEETGRLYFHGLNRGHKIDAMKNCSKVCYCVYDQGKHVGENWWLTVKSVIVFGRAHIIEDKALTEEISRKLCLKFTDDMEYIDKEVEKSLWRTLLFELEPEHISGKLVNER